VKKKDKDLEKEAPDLRNENHSDGQSTGSASEDSAPAAAEEPPVCDPQSEADSQETTAAGELEKELAEMKDRYLRLMAEYDNYRKRTAKEKETFYSMAKADTIERILPVYDNLERAVGNPTQDEAYKKGVEMIFQQLKDVFKLLGVNEIEASGQVFDPEKHNAVMHIEDESYGENTIVEVFQQGFELDGRVIRHSVVKVAN